MADRVIVVDRDGVINEDSDEYIKSPEEWKALPGSIEALSKLSHAGCRICVVSNQSGLGRGLFGLSELNDMHRKLRDLLAGQGAQIEMIAFCPHLPLSINRQHRQKTSALTPRRLPRTNNPRISRGATLISRSYLMHCGGHQIRATSSASWIGTPISSATSPSKTQRK